MTSSAIQLSDSELLRSLTQLKKQTAKNTKSSKRVKFNLEVEQNKSYKKKDNR